ncbi:MAG TPA: hypothetical protein PKL77_09995 [Candidatus Omnitrophota bacterium]|nr:hypothetical protein [Candidatus Omnitrophota bacterium]
MKKKKAYVSPTVTLLAPDLTKDITAVGQVCSTGSPVASSQYPLQCVTGPSAGGLCNTGTSAAVLCTTGSSGTAA